MHLYQACRSLLTAALATGLIAGPSFAQQSGTGMNAVIPGDTKLIDMKWEKAASPMPFGMRVLLVYGDPNKAGPYIYRIRVPTAYRIPPHKYSDDRVVTILKGKWWHGDGDRYDPFQMDEYGPGTTYVTKAGVPHFDFARTEVVLEVVGMGPVDNPIEYLNPEDDPTAKSKR
jgi:hypothetical protein